MNYSISCFKWNASVHVMTFLLVKFANLAFLFPIGTFWPVSAMDGTLIMDRVYDNCQVRIQRCMHLKLRNSPERTSLPFGTNKCQDCSGAYVILPGGRTCPSVCRTPPVSSTDSCQGSPPTFDLWTDHSGTRSMRPHDQGAWECTLQPWTLEAVDIVPNCSVGLLSNNVYPIGTFLQSPIWRKIEARELELEIN